MERNIEKEAEIEKAIKQCDYFINHRANIQVIDSRDGSIEMSSYDTTSLDIVNNALKESRFWLSKLIKSDGSKEESSIVYYNEMRYWKDRAIFYSKMMEEMLHYISNHMDCPLENEGFEADCENRCSNDEGNFIECWKYYFESKVRSDDIGI